MRTYYIHDNGGRPFKVTIDKKDVKVYKQYFEGDNYSYQDKPILVFDENIKIFIGKSPENKMTLFSGGYGPRFDGNSILLHIKENEYVYIGGKIFRFHSVDPLDQITKFVSPVGNSDVPYPYAVDKSNRYYLLIEDVMLEEVPLEYKEDPYTYYYKNKKLVSDFEEGDKLYFGGKRYDGLNYYPQPGKNYDRFTGFDDFRDGIKIVTKEGKPKKIDRKEFIKLSKAYGVRHGYSRLKGVKILQKRL